MNLNAAIVISAVDRTGAVFKQIERNSKVMDSVVQRSIANANAIGRNMTLGLTLPIGYGMARALKATGDFEQGLRVLEATSGATAEQMKRIRKQAEDLGASTVFSSRQVVDAQNMLVRNGLQLDQVLGGAAASAVNLAAATGAELSDAADIATAAMQNFKVAAAESDRIANQVAGTLIASKLDVNDYALAMGQAGGVVGGAGVSLEDFNAVLAGTSTAFSSGSDAGTSFKTFIGRLVPQSKEARTAMKELGLEFFNADGSMKSMAEVAQELNEGLGNLTDESRQRALNLIFGQDASRTALKMMEMGAAGVRKYREEIAKANAADQAAARMGGFAGAMEELSGAWETFRDKGLMDSGVLQDATVLLREAGDGIKWLGEQSPELLKFGTYALLATAAAGPLVWVLGSLAKVLATLSPLMPVLGLAAAVAGIKGAADNYDEIEKKWLETAPERADSFGSQLKRRLDREHAYEWDKRNDSLGSRSRRNVPPAQLVPEAPLHPSLMNDNLTPAATAMTVRAQEKILDGLKDVVKRLEKLLPFLPGMSMPGLNGAPGFGFGPFGFTGSLGGAASGAGAGPSGFPAALGAAPPTSILDMISEAEGTRGYEDSFAHQVATTLTDKTLDEIDAIQAGMTGSTAIGKHQVLRDTLLEERRKLRLRGDEKFDAAMQDRIAMSRLRYRGYDRWKPGDLSDAGFMSNLSQEWAGMTNPFTGRSFYAGQGTGFPIARQQAALNAERARMSQATEATLRYVNGAAVRSQKLTESLETRIVKAVGEVYGPGARADVFSGGQPATGLARVGSTRHNNGQAGDFYIYDAQGRRITGDGLAPLAQYWQAQGWGGTGLEMRGGGIHLDEHANRPRFWNYGHITQGQLAAVRAGQAGLFPPLNAPQGETPAATSEYARLRKLGADAPDVFSPSFRVRDRLEMGRGEVSVRLKLDKGLTADRTRLKQPENFSLGVGVDKTGEPGWNPPRVRERV